MKRKKIIVALVVVTMMIVSIPFIVSAATPAFNMASRMGNGHGPMSGGMSGGMNGEMKGEMKGEMNGEMDDAIQETLGLTMDQMQELRQQGKSLADIAKDQGVSIDTLVNKMVAEQTARINDMVEKGNITAAQKDAMLAQMKQRIVSNMNRTEVGPPTWAGKGQGMRMNGGGMGTGMGYGPGNNR